MATEDNLPARLTIKVEGQIGSFPDEKAKKIYFKPAMQEVLKCLL